MIGRSSCGSEVEGTVGDACRIKERAKIEDRNMLKTILKGGQHAYAEFFFFGSKIDDWKTERTNWLSCWSWVGSDGHMVEKRCKIICKQALVGSKRNKTVYSETCCVYEGTLMKEERNRGSEGRWNSHNWRQYGWRAHQRPS